MKKSVNPMDQLFKDQFQGAQTPVDADAMWSAVASQLPPEESKGYAMFSLIGLMLSLLLLALWFWPQEKTETTDAQELATTQVLPPSLSDTKAEAIVEIAHTLPQKPTPPAHQATLPIFTKEDLQAQKAAWTPFGKDEFEATSTDEAQEGDMGSTSELGTVSAFQALRRLSSTDITPFEHQEQSLLWAPDPDWSRCSDRRSWGVGFFIETYAFGGYPLITNALNADQNIDYSNFLTLWNQGESAVSTFAGGFMLGLETRGGVSLSAGLEYQQIQNRLNREQTIIERITVYDEMAYYFLDSNNNRVYVADSVTTTRTYTRSVQAAKTHTLINLPVLLGYHNQVGNFRYGIVAGVNIHLQNEFTGKVLDPSGQIIDANTGTSTAVYRTTMDLSFMGGLDFGYMTNDWLELYLSPRFRFQPGSWLNANHPLESTMQLVGLQAGLRMHL